MRLPPPGQGLRERILAVPTGRLEQLGRVIVVAVPVFAAAIVTRPGGLLVAFASALFLTIIWYACLNFGFTASMTTLAILGPRVAVTRGTVVGLIAITAIGHWIPALRVETGASFVVAAVILVLVTSWETIVAKRLTPLKRLLLVGPRNSCTGVIRELEYPAERRFFVVGVVDDQFDDSVADPYVLGRVRDMQRIVRTVRPDLVALVPGCDRPAVFAQLLDSADSGFRVLELAQFYEHAFGRVPVRDLTRAWFMSVLHLYQLPYSRRVKRASDLFGAVLLLLLTLPLFPVLAILVRSTRGPALLRQIRVGEHGRQFPMYKFRTMHVGAERPGEAVWAIANDRRITFAGRMMRRFRLDELPQIWNVALGHMSIVGPRPERPEFIDELLESVPFWTRRHLVKPGITGWAQVNRGYTADADGTIEKLGYDLWYIRHRNVTVDFAICMRTLATILRGDSARVQEEPPSSLDPIPTLLHLSSPPLLETDGV